MCSTALPPPPPPPITLICVPKLNSSIISIAIRFSNQSFIQCSCRIKQKSVLVVSRAQGLAHGGANPWADCTWSKQWCFIVCLRLLLEVAQEPVFGAAEQGLNRPRLLRRPDAAAARDARFLEQAHHRRGSRVRDHVVQRAGI